MASKKDEVELPAGVADPYAELEIDSSKGGAAVEEKTIKKQYRDLARKYHPDKQGGDEEMFKKLAKAYETLMNARGHNVTLFDVWADADDETLTQLEALRKASLNGRCADVQRLLNSGCATPDPDRLVTAPLLTRCASARAGWT